MNPTLCDWQSRSFIIRLAFCWICNLIGLEGNAGKWEPLQRCSEHSYFFVNVIHIPEKNQKAIFAGHRSGIC